MIIEIVQYQTVVNIQPQGGNVVDVVPDNRPEIITIEVLQGGGSEGTVTSISTSSPLTGGTITQSGTIGITKSDTSTDGYLSSTDWNIFNDKQDELVSGTNIKTINGDSVLGSGNLVISGGGAVDSVNGQTGVVVLDASDVGADVSGAAATAQSNAEAYVDSGLATKQNTLVSGTNIKTINSSSILGSGDLVVTGDVVSVNGQTGIVVLDASDVGADVSGAAAAALVTAEAYTDSAVAPLVPSARTISTTSPLSGGGNLSANRTIVISKSDTSTDGYLSSTDWNTFNNKQGTITTGNLTDVGTDGIVVTGGSGAVVGSGTSLAQHVSDSTHNGYLNSTDWNTFNNKQTALTIGDFTDAGTDGILVTGGSGAVIGSGTSIAQHVADTTHNGYLNSTDWNTFNNKQPSGSYLTSVTSDSPLSGSGTSGSHLVIANAAADGSTKGAAAFNSTYFDSASGVISPDLTNGLATSGQSGYLSSADWSTFNSKGSGTVSSVGVSSTDLSVSGSPITASGSITLNINTSVALGGNPTTTTQPTSDNSTKIATTAFVTTAINNAISGVNPAVAVQAATTANVAGYTYNNGVSGVGATLTQNSAAVVVIDGYTLALNNRVLFKNQSTAANNGVYTITTLGTGIIPAVFTRALDYNQPSDINNTGAIPVVNGTVNATTSWLLTSSVTTIGTDPITYVQFSYAPSSLVLTSRLINTTSPLSGGGDLSADRTLIIANAVADGSTKGAASFNANDFDSSSGNISIDYTNGQSSSASNKGFLTSADWVSFNSRDVMTIGLNPALLSAPADATTYYFSNFNAAPQSASSTIHQITIDRTCTLASININSVTGTAGSNEAWSLYVRVNDTTDTLIATVSSTAQGRVWANSTINISLTSGDKIIIKSICPTWATNPTNLVWAGYIRLTP